MTTVTHFRAKVDIPSYFSMQNLIKTATPQKTAKMLLQTLTRTNPRPCLSAGGRREGGRDGMGWVGWKVGEKDGMDGRKGWVRWDGWDGGREGWDGMGWDGIQG